jgi:hypothetical protein
MAGDEIASVFFQTSREEENKSDIAFCLRRSLYIVPAPIFGAAPPSLFMHVPAPLFVAFVRQVHNE